MERLVISRPAEHVAPVVVRTIVRPSVHEPSVHKEGAIGGGAGGDAGGGGAGIGGDAGGSAGVCPATNVQRPSKQRSLVTPSLHPAAGGFQTRTTVNNLRNSRTRLASRPSLSHTVCARRHHPPTPAHTMTCPPCAPRRYNQPMNDKLDNAVPVRKRTSLLLTATTAPPDPKRYIAWQPDGPTPALCHTPILNCHPNLCCHLTSAAMLTCAATLP